MEFRKSTVSALEQMYGSVLSYGSSAWSSPAFPNAVCHSRFKETHIPMYSCSPDTCIHSCTLPTPGATILLSAFLLLSSLDPGVTTCFLNYQKLLGEVQVHHTDWASSLGEDLTLPIVS